MTDNGTNFFLGSHDMQMNFEAYKNWAFSNVHAPVIRGSIIEFLLVRYLRERSDRIAGPTISKWTHDDPSGGKLNASTDPIYKNQPHMDTFDLQLHWGLTYELKSTDSPQNWTLRRTCRWSPFTRIHSTERIFPAQYYVLAVLNYDEFDYDRSLNFPDPVFYIKTGRQLDIDTKIPPEKQTTEHIELEKTHYNSIGFCNFKNNSATSSLTNLDIVLSRLALQEIVKQESNIHGTWQINRPEDELDNSKDKSQKKRNFIPFAFADGKCAWFEEVDGRLNYVKSISPPEWKREAKIGWRDWESVGFRFVNHDFPA